MTWHTFTILAENCTEMGKVDIQLIGECNQEIKTTDLCTIFLILKHRTTRKVQWEPLRGPIHLQLIFVVPLTEQGSKI